MIRVHGLVRGAVTAALAALLLGGAGAGIASAESVRGSGIVRYDHGAKDGENYFSTISVNAWLDEDGFAQGSVSWKGDWPQGLPGGSGYIPGGPAVPYAYKVTDLYFDGNTVYVEAVVIAAPDKNAIGSYNVFTFTDNSGTDDPDEINGVPIDSGSIIVIDD
jgi:hypothetical protein